jgi:hypothetical protein
MNTVGKLVRTAADGDVGKQDMRVMQGSASGDDEAGEVAESEHGRCRRLKDVGRVAEEACFGTQQAEGAPGQSLRETRPGRPQRAAGGRQEAERKGE